MDKVFCQVFMVDGVSHTLALSPSANAEEAKRALLVKITATPDPDLNVWRFFRIVESSSDGWERALLPTENIGQVVAKRKIPISSATAMPHNRQSMLIMEDQDEEATWRLVFKRLLFLGTSPQVCPEFNNPLAMRFIYNQMSHVILNSMISCPQDEAIYLGALQAFITFGKKIADHSPGFFVNSKQIPNFIPEDLLKQKSPSDWELLILAQWERLDPQLTKTQAQSLYVRRISTRSIFGTAFFRASPLSAPVAKSNNDLLIGVNSDGISIMNLNKEILAVFAYHTISSWGYNKTTFSFECLTEKNHTEKNVLLLKHPEFLASLMDDYVKLISKLITFEK